MKTEITLRFYSGALALFLLLPLASTASEPTEAQNTPPTERQTHVLFTGADIRILYNGKMYPVDDVDGTSLAIRIKDNAKTLDVPLDYKRKQLVVDRVQTVTDRSATVTNFRHEPAYTAANDPARKGSEAIQTAIAMTDNARMMAEKVAREPETIKVFRGGTAPVEVANPLREKMGQQLEMMQSTISGPLGIGGRADAMAEELARKDFDALEVEFEVSAQSPIKRAYAVVIANYHPKEHPKDSKMWLAARELGQIDSTSRKVWLREGGLPPGYVLENVRLHLYERGVEIATDLSENRADLTRDEAHEYLVLDHTAVHKADTVPARLVLTRVPADWAIHPRDRSFDKIFYVKVDKTGRPLGAFEDEICETAVANPYYEAVLRDQLFLPALEKGTAVDSVVRIKLSKIPHN